jgi:hypothetical protein
VEPDGAADVKALGSRHLGCFQEVTAMVRDAKRKANRRNALRSTGPRTPEGKAVSRMNAVRHGLLARLPVIPGLESQKDWEAHLAQVFDDLCPVGYIEETFTERIALLLWKLGRAARYEREVSAIRIELANKNAADELSDVKYRPGFSVTSAEDRRHARSFLRRFPKMRDAAPVDSDDVVCLVKEAETAADVHLDATEMDKVHSRRENWTAAELRAILDRIAKDGGMTRDDLLEEISNWVEGRIDERLDAEAEAEGKASRRCRKSLLPPDEHLDKTVRYEGHMERSLYKALHELLRLQAAREGGDHVPPPAAPD